MVPKWGTWRKKLRISLITIKFRFHLCFRWINSAKKWFDSWSSWSKSFEEPTALGKDKIKGKNCFYNRPMENEQIESSMRTAQLINDMLVLKMQNLQSWLNYCTFYEPKIRWFSSYGEHKVTVTFLNHNISQWRYTNGAELLQEFKNSFLFKQSCHNWRYYRHNVVGKLKDLKIQKTLWL
jgi:hypothetical protein